ncbi:unannotated protein [freshwater metagenome]|uniref:Unannotated protein n=1 Tax=freshwater metagenome TaxID=449393 RepID=A0A6J6D0A7_9ZZZZ
MSQFAAAPASEPASTQAVVGFGVTPSKTETFIPADSRLSFTSAHIGEAPKNGSVIISALLAPWATASSPTFETAPTPKCAAGFASRTNS